MPRQHPPPEHCLQKKASPEGGGNCRKRLSPEGRLLPCIPAPGRRLCASHTGPRVGHAEGALPFCSHHTRATHRALPGTCRGGQATVCGHPPPEKKKTVFVSRDKPGEVTGRETHPRTQRGEGHATARGQEEGGRRRLAVVPSLGTLLAPCTESRRPARGHHAGALRRPWSHGSPSPITTSSWLPAASLSPRVRAQLGPRNQSHPELREHN